MCGKRSGELLGLSTQSGVAPLVRDWALGLAPFLSHWTGEYLTALQAQMYGYLTYTLNLGTVHGKPSPLPSWSEHMSDMRWDR